MMFINCRHVIKWIKCSLWSRIQYTLALTNRTYHWTHYPISKCGSIKFILTQNLYKSRYNHLSEPKWPRMSIFPFTSTAKKAHNTQRWMGAWQQHSTRQAALHQRHRRLIQYRLSSVFTADYIIEVGEITPLFMLPLWHYKWEACKLPAVYLIMQSV